MSASNEQNVEQWIVDFIGEKIPLPPGVDRASYDYVAAGHVDSMRLIRFVVDLESRFDIEIDDADIEDPRFRTVDGVIAIVREKLAVSA